jgi:hypothetical protein
MRLVLVALALALLVVGAVLAVVLGGVPAG